MEIVALPRLRSPPFASPCRIPFSSMRTFALTRHLFFFFLCLWSLTLAQEESAPPCDCAPAVAAAQAPLQQELQTLQDQKHALLQDIEQLRKSLDVTRQDVQNMVADRDEWERRARAWEQEHTLAQQEIERLSNVTLLALLQKQIAAFYEAIEDFFKNLTQKKKQEEQDL